MATVKQATVYDIKTGKPKVVDVGDPRAFEGGFTLDKPGTEEFLRRQQGISSSLTPEEARAMGLQQVADPRSLSLLRPEQIQRTTGREIFTQPGVQVPPPPSTNGALQRDLTFDEPPPQKRGKDPLISFNEAIMGMLKKAQGTGGDKDLLAQRNALVQARFNARSQQTPEELQILSPQQQAALRSGDVRAIETQLLGINTALQGRERERGTAMKLLNVQRDIIREIAETQKPVLRSAGNDLIQIMPDGSVKVVYSAPKEQANLHAKSKDVLAGTDPDLRTFAALRPDLKIGTPEFQQGFNQFIAQQGALRRAPGGKTEKEIAEQNARDLTAGEIQSIRGSDGFVDTAKYQGVREDLAREAPSLLSWFDKTYPVDRVLNPNDPTAQNILRTTTGGRDIIKSQERDVPLFDEAKIRDTFTDRELRKAAAEAGFKKGGGLFTRDFGVGDEGLQEFINELIRKMDQAIAVGQTSKKANEILIDLIRSAQ